MKKQAVPHPFVKWAGGKGQLIDRLQARMPKDYKDYIEPFVGGGAMFLSLAEQGEFDGKRVVINDVNEALIATYRCVRDDVDELVDGISKLDAGLSTDKEQVKAYYYEQRVEFNKYLEAREYGVESSALFIWVNKHAFNGLYRLNRKGLYNVPWSQSIRPCLDEENLRAISEVLKTVDIEQGDFADIALSAKTGDFVFLDSPYVPVKVDSFTDYTADGFTYEDHVRLAETYRELADRGVYVMETNHNVDLIYELYDGFDIEVVDVKRMINSDASKRTGQEVIITNYDKGTEVE